MTSLYLKPYVYRWLNYCSSIELYEPYNLISETYTTVSEKSAFRPWSWAHLTLAYTAMLGPFGCLINGSDFEIGGILKKIPRPWMFFGGGPSFPTKKCNWMKNQIPDLYFSSYDHFSDVITPIIDEFFTITRKIKIGELFFIHFSTLRIFHESGIKTEGGGCACRQSGQSQKNVRLKMVWNVC